MVKRKVVKSEGMKPARLETLADGIFAIAMTLLVLSVNLPGLGRSIDVGAFLLGQYQNFWNFALSFLLLAIFWLNHSQQFNHIKRTNAGLLFINIFILLFVALIPFSTSLMNDHSNSLVALLFFNSNMLILSSMLSFNWWYADKRQLLNAAGSKKHIVQVTKKGLYFPTIALIALVLSFFIHAWSTLVYLLIPLAMFMPAIKKGKSRNG